MWGKIQGEYFRLARKTAALVDQHWPPNTHKDVEQRRVTIHEHLGRPHLGRGFCQSLFVHNSLIGHNIALGHLTKRRTRFKFLPILSIGSVGSSIRVSPFMSKSAMLYTERMGDCLSVVAGTPAATEAICREAAESC